VVVMVAEEVAASVKESGNTHLAVSLVYSLQGVLAK
jgi:hypothetical protein